MHNRKAPAVTHRDCPDFTDLAGFLAGSLDQKRADYVGSHLAGCSFCAAAFKELIGGSPFATAEEDELIEALPSAGSEGRRQLAGRLAQTGHSWPWALRGVAAVAGILLTAAVAWSLWHRLQPAPAVRLARSYGEARPFDYKFADAEYGEVAARRSVSGITAASPELLALGADVARQLQARPDDPEVLANAGRMAALMSDLATACDRLKRAYALHPQDIAIVKDYAAVLAARARASDNPVDQNHALDVLSGVLRRDPGDWTARFNRALILQDLGRTPEARLEWQKCLSQDIPATWRREIERRIRE